MTRRGHASIGDRSLDFFISYSPADERWATWIAWELESAGYRTMLQAWDFVPGTNFIDFMDRGVSEATVVVAVLSKSYARSRYGRLEWQAALRADPENPSSKLVTIRIEDAPLDGLLSMITYVDLADVDDPDVARAQLLNRISEALAGRAKPARQPGYPQGGPTGPGVPSSLPGAVPTSRLRSRRTPVTPPLYPPTMPSAWQPRSALTVLHVPGPRFGRGLVRAGAPATAGDLQARIWGDLAQLANDGGPSPDLLLVTGDLTESGSRREFDEALTFLTGLRVLLGLEPHRLLVVPGSHDVNQAACRAYFANCEADDIAPQPPYWHKWRHYARLFEELYQGLDGPVFDSEQPWTLFPVPDLQVVVAGLNSTMAQTHLEDDNYGWISESQAAWFAQRLQPFAEAGWLRIGALSHIPTTGDRMPADDRVAVRDTGTLDRLLGRRLNLLVHGGEQQTGALGSLGSQLLVVPPLGAGRHQLLQLTADGLDRWPGSPLDSEPAGAVPEPERVERQWHAVGATFTSPADAPQVGVLEPTEAAVGTNTDGVRGQSPAALLLDRIVEICETRYDRARLRRIDGDPPHLFVTYREEGFVRQLRVAAVVGEPTEQNVDAFIQYAHAADADQGSELVYDGPAPPQGLRDYALRGGVRLRSFTEFQGLLDLRDYVSAQSARLRASGSYPPELYVPQRFRELVGPQPGIQNDVVAEMLKLLAADDGRFVLVLGDFGRGKTFSLRELARRIPTELPHLIPILIELRALDKAHSIDGLVAAHLANHGNELIDLKAFHYMLRQGRIVLLFDGFDELVTRVSYDRAADHLDTLLSAAQDKAKVVLASRTQHFRTHAQVLTALGERVGLLPHRRVLSLEEFSSAQIREYLVNRYGGEEAAADRYELLGGIEDLLGLSRNPRMLSFIADLDPEQLHAVASATDTISAADLYGQILRAWLLYEERRTQGVPGAPVGLQAAELWDAVTLLALRLWETNETYLRLSELSEIAETLTGLVSGNLSVVQTTHAVGAGSLLIRTDEGFFGFIHSSVVEWLVADAIASQFNAGVAAPQQLATRPLSQLTVDFLCDLADTGTAQDWVRAVLGDADADDVSRANAIKISTRLRTPAQTDLRGASLKGEDLSHRSMQGVNLSDADLTDAQLVGTDLSGANLRNARLVRAKLNEAQLTDADLTGADLSGARLMHADLRGVTVESSRWHRAALIDVAADPELFTAPELRGAAIAPGGAVDAALAPGAVGVSFGFEAGRIPRPVAYSGDGETLAIGSDDGGVLVCDARSGHPVRTLQGHRGRVYVVAYAGTGSLFVTGAADGTVRLWDSATGESLDRIDGHQDWVWPLVLSPDGSVVASGDSSGTMRIIETATGAIRHRLPGFPSHIWTAGFHPHEPLLATGDVTGKVTVWDTSTGAVRLQLPVHDGSVYRLSFSRDGALLATADHGGTVRVFDAETGVLRHAFTGHRSAVYTLDFNPDTTLLASGDTKGAVKVWDPRTGELVRSVPSHTGAVYRVVFSPDGTLLATGDSDGVVRLLTVGDFELRHELTGHKGSLWPMVFRPDGRQLVTSSNEGTTRLWDVATGEYQRILSGHGRRITSVRFNADGSALATSGNDGVVRIWEPQTGRRRRQFVGIADRLISAIFTPETKLLATASNDGTVYLWNTETGNFERELNVGTDHVWAEAFSPDGDILATANDDDSVQLWYRTTGRRVRRLEGHHGRVRSVSFSPDGATIATGCDDRAVRLFATATGECRAVLRGHTERVYSVVFSRDGTLLASASNDGTARIWDAATGALRHSLMRHTGRLWSVAFNPDGTLLATAGDDLVIRLWDPRTGKHLQTLTRHTRRISSVDFSPDGTLLASGGDDGTVRLWDVSDRDDPVLRATLLGLPDGWAALSPDGTYKFEGDVAGQFWHVIGLCRFEPGELAPYLPDIRPAAVDAELGR